MCANFQLTCIKNLSTFWLTVAVNDQDKEIYKWILIDY